MLCVVADCVLLCVPFSLVQSQVESDLADKIEKVVRCNLTPMQRTMYESILEGKVSMHNRVMQLRKICNHPILFHPYLRSQAGSTPYTPDETIIKMCGKFTLLDQILHKLKRTGHRVLIFNQMTKVMDILEEYCNLRKFTFLRLDGSTSADVRTQSVIQFNAPDSPYFIFMLSTKAGGLGLNLQSADTVILFDSDWNPSNDAQAMARSHRIGQKKQCLALRFITTATVEEKVLSTATTKLSHEQMVIQAGMFHTRYSHNASRAIAAEAMAKERKLEDDTGDDQDEQWTDDFISRTLARSDEELAIFQEMDQLAKRSEAAAGVSRDLPDNKMPKWCWDWCVHGHHSSNSEQGLVPFSDKLLEAARAKATKNSIEDPLNPKPRAKSQAIVEVNTSDSDDEYGDVVAEASGVNDAALAEDDDRPLNYDDIDDDDEPMTSAPPLPDPALVSSLASVPLTPLAVSKKAKKSSSTAKRPSQSKRKREDDINQMIDPAAINDATAATPQPAKKKKKESDGTAKRASSKKKPVAPLTYDDDHYQPLSYSDVDNEDDVTHDAYNSGPTIAATSSGGIKLVIRSGGAASATPAAAKKIPKKKAAASSSSLPHTGPILINKAGGSLSFSLSTAGINRP